MKIEYLESFSKDLDKLESKRIKTKLLGLNQQIESADSFMDISNLKKLQGFKNAYRIWIGDYRLGFFYDEDTITLARFVNRKDIYKLFP